MTTLEELRAVRVSFATAAGDLLRLDKAILAPEGNAQILTVTGWHKDGKPFAQTTEPFKTDPSERAKLMAQDIIRAYTGWPASGARTVGKFATIGDRLKTVKQGLEDRADKLASRIEAVNTRGHSGMDGYDRYLDQTESDLSALEQEISRMTNGAPPLESSGA